jgi:hypothetical protein
LQMAPAQCFIAFLSGLDEPQVLGGCQLGGPGLPYPEDSDAAPNP